MPVFKTVVKKVPVIKPGECTMVVHMRTTGVLSRGYSTLKHLVLDTVEVALGLQHTGQVMSRLVDMYIGCQQAPVYEIWWTTR